MTEVIDHLPLSPWRQEVWLAIIRNEHARRELLSRLAELEEETELIEELSQVLDQLERE